MPAQLLEMGFERVLESAQSMSSLPDEGILMVRAKNGVTLIRVVEANVPEMLPVIFQAASLDAFENEFGGLNSLGN